MQEMESTNRGEMLFFSNQFNVYKMKLSDIPDSKASSMGEYLQNLLGMDAEEKILYMTVTQDYSGFMVFFFENGKGAKVQLSAYATKANRRKLVNAYSARSPLVYMEKLDADVDFLLMRNHDKATLLNTELIPKAHPVCSFIPSRKTAASPKSALRHNSRQTILNITGHGKFQQQGISFRKKTKLPMMFPDRSSYKLLQKKDFFPRKKSFFLVKCSTFLFPPLPFIDLSFTMVL